MKNKLLRLPVGVAAVLYWLSLGCSGPVEISTIRPVSEPSGDESPTEVGLPRLKEPLSSFDTNKYKVSQTVCDPFDENSGASSPSAGVKAQLFYRRQEDPRWYDVSSYVEKGQNSDQTLFFSEINVPTRLFSLGFPTEAGETVKTLSGDNLFEYFALRFSGKIQLAASQEEGLYELAVLSDDGTILILADDDGLMQTVVNNDGDHPTRMGCGAKVTMTRNAAREFELKYYQGPRHHISVIPMWRKVTAETAADPLCGRSGNSLFFDFKNNSAPLAAYNQLLGRGWQPLGKENYRLEDDEDHNPCYQGATPTISNYTMNTSSDVSITFSWQTNIPATAKLLIRNLDTGIQNETNSDNVLRTNHSISLPQIFNPGTRYSVRAIAISDTLGKTLSEPIEFVGR